MREPILNFQNFSRYLLQKSNYLYCMSQNKTIFLPNAESLGQMIEKSWQQCKKQAEEAGLPLTNPDLEAFAKDMFVAGYTFGYNDNLGVIRGQLEVMELAGNMFNKES